MGVISQGILGGFSGKVGNVIGASWKGIHYIRIKPASVANPRTEGQVNQRTKFSATLAFLQPSLAFLKVGYKFYASKQSAFNAAMSYVIKNAIIGSAPNFSIDPASALLSRGKLTGAIGSNVSHELGTLTIGWTDNQEEGNARPDDQAMLLAYNPTRQESIMDLAAATRTDGTGVLSIPTTYAGETIEVYMAFVAADGRKSLLAAAGADEGRQMAAGRSAADDVYAYMQIAYPLGFVLIAAEGSLHSVLPRDRRPITRRVATKVINKVLWASLGFTGTDTHGLKAFLRAPLLPIVTPMRIV